MSYLQLGSYRYYPERQKLLDGSERELKLRPQSLAVLHLLASDPGEVVTKDQIFKTVWPGINVTDDSLVQCIADIRRALGDEGRTLLKTVPRRGYLLQVEKPPSSEQEWGQAVSLKQNAAGNRQYAKWPGLMQRPEFPILLIGLCLLLVVFSLVPWSQGTPDGPDKAEVTAKPQPVSVAVNPDTPGLAVAMAGNIAADSAEPLAALLQELRVVLGRYSTIQLVDDAKADYFLTINAHGFGNKASIRQATMELNGADGESVVFAESYDVADEENAMRKVAIRAAAAVASPGLGAIARHIRETTRLKPVAELKPAECYVYGYGCSKCSGEEDNITQRAEACLVHVLNKNPQDARAWALQATIYAHQYWYGNTLPEPQRSTLSLRKHLPELAIKAANKAEALSSGGDSSVYWGMVEAYMTSCQPDKLQTAVQRGLEINPDDPNLLASFGNWLSYSGRWHEGAALTRRALAIEPKHYRKWWWMGIAKTHYRFDENEEAYAAFMKAFNERNWVSHLQLAYTLPYLGREDEARLAVKNMMYLYPGLTLERALEFYKVLCFDDVFLAKMKKALIIAGLPSRGDSSDFNNIQPPTAKTISVNGVDLEYIDVGKGEPVLFVHGAVSDYRSWLRFMVPISENHRFISYSRRYYGTQPWPDQGEQWSSDTFTADLAAFIEALDLGPVHLVSWSSGGLVAHLLAAQRPDLVKSAIHYEPVVHSIMQGNAADEALLKEWRARWGKWAQHMKEKDDESAAAELINIVFELPENGFKDELEITKELTRQNAGNLKLGWTSKGSIQIDCDYLQQINTPSLIALGSETNAYWSRMSEKFTECLPNASLKIVQGINHKGPIESSEELSRLIIDFVEANR